LIERALQPASAAIVVGVRARSPAAIAGVQVGDVVVGVNGRRVFTAQDFATMTAGEWRKTPPMRRMALTVQRAGGEVTTPFVKPEPPPPRVP
jgi:S1-C subfamily serine protease